MLTSDNNDAEIENIYDETGEIQHQEGTGQVKANHIDFNNIIEGCERMIVDDYGLGRKNDRGRMLINFCQ